MSTYVKLITMDFDDVRSRFLEARAAGRWQSQPILDRLVRQAWTKDVQAQWDGGTGGDTERWLREGYYAETFALNDLAIEPRVRSRASWSEDDGDIDPGRLYGGADEYMLTQADREVMPGLTVEIEYDFGASANAESIEAYGQWIARLIASMEATGYDLDIALIVRATDLFAGERREGRTDIRINVKKGGEISNFTSWSAIFAPTGFRHLVFTAYGVAADALGKRLANGLGGPVTSGWGCKVDGHVISIGCDSRAGDNFPAEQLTAEAREAGLFQ